MLLPHRIDGNPVGDKVKCFCIKREPVFKGVCMEGEPVFKGVFTEGELTLGTTKKVSVTERRAAIQHRLYRPYRPFWDEVIEANS